MKKTAPSPRSALFFDDVYYMYKVCAIISKLPPPYWQQEGGVLMNEISSFIVSLMAGIVCHYLCRWLDGE